MIKHIQRQEERERQIDDFRDNARLGKRRKPLILENPDLSDRKNPDELRQEAIAELLSMLRLSNYPDAERKWRSIAERYADALANGQGDIFLRTLDT